MEAPVGRMSPQDLKAELEKHVAANYEKRDGALACRKCGAGILEVTCYISLHVAEFGDACAGTGRVVHAPLPYCPTCEGEPKNIRTCVHVHMFAEPAKQTKLPASAGE